jgi:uncharacterized RDD family membrane protein YckC
MTTSGPEVVYDHSLRYVGFWRRACANIIDAALFAAVTFPILGAVQGWDQWLTWNFTLLGFLLNRVWPAIVTIYFWKAKQATPGKMVIKARIVDARTGRTPSTRQLVGRYLARYLSAIPFGLGVISIAWDPRKQSWHDKLANTVVIGPA